MTTMTRLKNAWRGLTQAKEPTEITIAGETLSWEQIRRLAQQGRLELREPTGGSYLEPHGEHVDDLYSED